MQSLANKAWPANCPAGSRTGRAVCGYGGTSGPDEALEEESAEREEASELEAAEVTLEAAP